MDGEVIIRDRKLTRMKEDDIYAEVEAVMAGDTADGESKPKRDRKKAS